MATTLPTDYTDATWTGNRKYKMINNSDGTVSFEDVTEYTNKENSFFGASDANAMNAAVNELNTNLTSVQTNLNNNMTLDQIRNMIRPDLSDKKTDLLEISFDRWSTVNRTRTFYAPTTNVPSAITSSAFMGLWECIWIDSTHVGVRLTEMFPQRGRIWTNFYNYKQWEGWASNT